MFELDLILDAVFVLDLSKDFALVEPLSETFVPAFAKVKVFPSWDVELFHNLLCLVQDVLASHLRIVEDKVGKTHLHLRKLSLSAAFFLLQFFGVVPSRDVLGMYVQLSGFVPDDLRQIIVVPSNLLTDGRDQFLLELNRVAPVCNCTFSMTRLLALALDLGSTVLFVEFVSFLQNFDVYPV